MQAHSRRLRLVLHAVMALGLLLPVSFLQAQRATADSPLAGTWELADVFGTKPDGSRAHTCAQHPVGLLILDAPGRYSPQIFNPDRPKFTSGEKARGPADEYRAATVGTSAHSGRCEIDESHGAVVCRIAHASHPNLEGTTQRRFYQLIGDEFSYYIPARAGGNIPVSVWRRVLRPITQAGLPLSAPSASEFNLRLPARSSQIAAIVAWPRKPSSEQALTMADCRRL